jgi:hypothetical protein
MWASFCNLKKHKINNHPLGENSPNLVTLHPTTAKSNKGHLKSMIFINKTKDVCLHM